MSSDGVCIVCGRSDGETKRHAEEIRVGGGVYPVCPSCSREYQSFAGVEVETISCLHLMAMEFERHFEAEASLPLSAKWYFQGMVRAMGKRFSASAYRNACGCVTCSRLAKGQWRQRRDDGVSRWELQNPDLVEAVEELRAASPSFVGETDEEGEERCRKNRNATRLPGTGPLARRAMAAVVKWPTDKTRNIVLTPAYSGGRRDFNRVKERVFYDALNVQFVWEVLTWRFEKTGPDRMDPKTGELLNYTRRDEWCRAGAGPTLWAALQCGEKEVNTVFRDSFGYKPDFPLIAAQYLASRSKRKGRKYDGNSD